MCVQAKGPLAIVDKVVILILTDSCIFDLVRPWNMSPMTMQK